MSERSLFIRALEIDDPAERAELLDRECGDDDALRQRIEKLLSAHTAAGGILDKPPVTPPATDLFRPITEGPGTVIGPYKLLQQIGEGGFGVVYMAEQQRPVRRKVALKIIKPGMDTREVIARFESERQALALMDHPNIARVLDAGATDSGRPYFVMELVKGVPITDYCDKNTLPTEKRLELFITVCHAVQHAHQKGVIHRDIKPSNVMVTLHDGHPVPKVIDFGVSKATSQQLTERTLFTAYGQMIGTPAYMSPEQAEMSGLDIDTRSDLYSLGVLLYELLTGSTPFDGKRLREAGYLEMQRIIREEAPPRPSTRVSTLGEALTVLSTQRSTDPKKLGQLLRGDLDVIVMKALEKERGRRYDTPNAFAEDIRRFLNHEAIIARPASTAYRLKKFVQRNVAAVAAVSAIAAALLIGTLISAIAARNALYNRRLAEESLKVALADRQQAEQAQKNTVAALQTAERERDRAEKAKTEESKQRAQAEQQRLAAEAAEKSAATERTAAIQERDRATAANAELAKQKEQQRRLLYGAQMSLIKSAWDADNTGRVRELLNATRPRPGQEDLRGFEWHHWQRQMHGEERTISLELDSFFSRSPSSGLAVLQSPMFSADGKLLADVIKFPAVSLPSDLSGKFLVRLWDTETGKLKLEKRIDGGMFALGNEISQLAVCFVSAERIGLQNLSTGFRPPTQPRPTNPIEAIQSSRTPAGLLVLDGATGEDVFTKQVEYFSAGGKAFVFSRDGSRIAAVLEQPVVQVWDGRTGAEIERVEIPLREGLPWSGAYVALSPDGTKLAMKAGISRSARAEPLGITIAELGTDRRVTTPPVMMTRLEFTSDGSRLIVQGSDLFDERGRLFDVSTGDEIRLASQPLPASDQRTANSRYVLTGVVQFSPDGQRFALLREPQLNQPNGISAVRGRTATKVTLCSTETGEVIQEYRGPTRPFIQIEFNADGSRLFSAHGDGTICVWPVPAAGASQLPLANRPPANSVASESRRRRSPDGRWEFGEPLGRSSFGLPPRTPEESDNIAPPPNPTTLRTTDTTGKIPERNIPVAGTSSTAFFSPDGQRVAILSLNQEGDLATAVEFKVWNLATDHEVFSRRLPATERTLRSSSVFSRPAVTPSVPRGPLRTYAGAITPPAFSADNTHMATLIRERTGHGGSPQMRLHLWNFHNGQELVTDPEPIVPSRIEFHGDLVIALPNQPPLASRGGNPFEVTPGIQVWNIATGKPVWSDEHCTTAWVSPDAMVVAGLIPESTESSKIVVWRMASGEQIGVLPETSDRSTSNIVFLNAGRTLSVVSGRVATCYETASGIQCAELRGHQSAIVAIGASEDGERIATAASPTSTASGFGGPVGRQTEISEIKLWDAVTGQELVSLPGFPLRLDAGFTGGFQPRSLLNVSLTDHRLSLSEDRIREVAPLSADAAAKEFSDWLNSVVASEGVLTRTQIDEYLAADKSLNEAARELVRQTMSSRRSPSALIDRAGPADLLRRDATPAQYERALALIREANERNTSGITVLHFEALAEYRLGNFTSALAVAKRAVDGAAARQRSPLAEDLTILAMVQHQLGQNAEAHQSLERARTIASRNESFWQDLLSEAETKLAIPLAAATPDRWVGQRFMTRLNPRVTDEAGRPTASFNVPITIARVEGNRLWFGKNAIERSDVVPLETAIAYFTSALELNPASTNVLGNRGIAWRALGEPEKAIEDYSAAIRLNPTNAAPLASRGRIYGYELDDFEKALADFDASLKLQPANAHTLENRGEMLWRLGRMDVALENLDQAIRLDANCREAYGVRAQVWSAKGDRDKMRQDLDESIHRHPENRFAWCLRAWALATSPVAEHRDGPLAVAAAIKACELTFWKDAHCLDILAAAHAEDTNFSEAVKWAEQAVTLAPKHKRAKYESRLALYRQNKPYRDTANLQRTPPNQP